MPWRFRQRCRLERVRIRGEITTSILLLVPSHGLISLLPWEPTASVTDLETAAVNSPRILTLLAEPVTHVVEALRPTRPAQPVRPRVNRRQAARARASLRAQALDEDAPFHDDPLPW